jgi:AraC family transcriptional regulator, transcriptional activator FtrA
MWIASGTWPLVKACRFRTSRRMKSTVPETCAAYTSEQSVSNRSLSSKCATASTGEAAGDSSTRLLAFFTNAGVDTSVAVLIRASFTLSSDYALLRPHLRVAEMSTSIRIMPKGKKLPHRVVALAYDGLCTFEFGIVVEMFGLPRPEFDHWYEFEVAAVDPGPIRATGGVILQTTSRGLSVLAKADTIIIPGWRGTDAPVPTDLVRALRGAFARGARLISICSGVFVLAATGLLDGRQATTHWRYASTLRERYPKITVDPDILYTGDGMIFTSAGSAAGLDLCMHIIRKDYGVHIANAVARRLVIPPHREGGQVQFISSPIGEENIPWLSQLFAWIDANLERRITIDQLAGRA